MLGALLNTQAVAQGFVMLGVVWLDRDMCHQVLRTHQMMGLNTESCWWLVQDWSVGCQPQVCVLSSSKLHTTTMSTLAAGSMPRVSPSHCHITCHPISHQAH
jgi:hypothetical protein